MGAMARRVGLLDGIRREVCGGSKKIIIFF